MLASMFGDGHIAHMPERPRLDWRFIGVATLILTCLVTLSRVGRPGGPSFGVLHDRQTIAWLTWVLLAPAIIAVATNFPFGDGSAMKWLWRHVGAGFGFSVAALLISGAIELVLGAGHSLPGAPRPPSMTSSLATGLLLYALIAVSYQALSYHRAAKEREAVAAKLRADLAEARLTTLEGQLHPHFLFNSLNSIAALMRVDAAQAETMLEQLSELLRATLRTNPMREVALDDALHLAEQYLAIEQVRFRERLTTTVEATGAARKGQVPQLILQPLVENAVRHGIAPLESGGSVKVTAVVDNDRLHIAVEDDGVGIGNAPAERAGSGLGLRSVRSLLSHLYGSDQRFDVAPRTPNGTTVTIVIPYRPAVA